jgi:EAL domain-containing protein (putative c-di-GMP-specific phosphodiesterase class I)
LIVDIGRWVLFAACQTIVQWNEGRETPLKMSVNLSGRQFLMNDLVQTVRTALAATGCQPNWLELEITESLLLEDSHSVRSMLDDLSDLGLSIALDDFGTGYSALGYLNRFPIDVLKIDRTFVRDIEIDENKLGVTKAIISIAEALHLDLIAEGVENAEQAAILTALGCNTLQGYLYSKAIPKDEFRALMLSCQAKLLQFG